MVKGTVTWFSEQKGYGYISPNDGDENIFVHYTAIVGSGFRSLKEGERVSYVPAREPVIKSCSGLLFGGHPSYDV
jgi:cold shock protein